MRRILLFFTFLCVSAKEKTQVIVLNDSDWKTMLSGEWLVAFYAPWCPACQALKTTWESVASWSKDLDIKVAKIDVTENPALSGRFLVTALPSIYHVKDGAFRQYQDVRSETEIIAFVDDKKYEKVEPVAWYKSPTSLHMAIMGQFFKFSMHIRNIHTVLTEQYGVPFWGSYLLFAAATIIVGLLLGLILVILCDFAFPPKFPTPPLPKQYDPLRQNTRPATEGNKEEESDILDDRANIADAESSEKQGDQAKPSPKEDVRKRKAKAKTTD